MFDTKKKYEELKIAYDILKIKYQTCNEELTQITNKWLKEIENLKAKQRHYNWRWGYKRNI